MTKEELEELKEEEIALNNMIIRVDKELYIAFRIKDTNYIINI